MLASLTIDRLRRMRPFVMTTWLLSFKEAQQAGAASAEMFLNQIEPLTELAGMSLYDAVSIYANPDHEYDRVFDPDIRFVRLVLGHPGPIADERMVTRALALTLDQVRGSPVEASRLFRDLDDVTHWYFGRPPRAGMTAAALSSRPVAETNRLMSNTLFETLRRDPTRASDADRDPELAGGDPCRPPPPQQ